MNRAQKQAPDSILGADVNTALHTLITLSRKLVEFADRETHSLAMGDYMSFAYTQQDKENLAKRYTQASQEFRARVEDFRVADKGLLQRLDKIQIELKEKTEGNNLIIGQIKNRAMANTKSTLFSVQEMGQRMRPMANEQQQKGA